MQWRHFENINLERRQRLFLASILAKNIGEEGEFSEEKKPSSQERWNAHICQQRSWCTNLGLPRSAHNFPQGMRKGHRWGKFGTYLAQLSQIWIKAVSITKNMTRKERKKRPTQWGAASNVSFCANIAAFYWLILTQKHSGHESLDQSSTLHLN